MNFKEVFVTNKLKHVEEDLGVISEQLMWLHDFITKEFGEKFKTFLEYRTREAQKLARLSTTKHINRFKRIANVDVTSPSKNKRSRVNHERSRRNNDKTSSSENESSQEYEQERNSDSGGVLADEEESNKLPIYNALEVEEDDDCSNSSRFPKYFTDANARPTSTTMVNTEVNKTHHPIKNTKCNTSTTADHGHFNQPSEITTFETIDASLIFPCSDRIEISLETNDVLSSPSGGAGAPPTSANESDQPQNGLSKTEPVRRRRRNKIPTPEQWERSIATSKRLKGEAYTVKKKINGKAVTYQVPAKKLGNRCQSRVCKKIKDMHCSKISDSRRKDIFNNFWKHMSWKEKRAYVASLVDVVPKKRLTTGKESRRKVTLLYHLIDENDERVRVCQKTFKNLLDIGSTCIQSWITEANSNNPKLKTEKTTSTSNSDSD